jgi:hypothetical protein
VLKLIQQPDGGFLPDFWDTILDIIEGTGCERAEMAVEKDCEGRTGRPNFVPVGQRVSGTLVIRSGPEGKARNTLAAIRNAADAITAILKAKGLVVTERGTITEEYHRNQDAGTPNRPNQVAYRADIPFVVTGEFPVVP